MEATGCRRHALDVGRMGDNEMPHTTSELMHLLILGLTLLGTYLAWPVMLVAAVLYWKRRCDLASFALCISIICMGCGGLLYSLPVAYHESTVCGPDGQPLAGMKPNWIWYFGQFLSKFGLLALAGAFLSCSLRTARR